MLLLFASSIYGTTHASEIASDVMEFGSFILVS